MKIGITGASGFIGSKIAALSVEQGHTVTGFTRDPSRQLPACAETRMFSQSETMNIEGCEAIIHLAGESVFGLWTSAKRRRIFDSRILGTRQVVNAILASPEPARVLVCASAIGFYGDTGNREVDEDAPAGHGFLAEVTQSWEIEALRAREKNVRVVLLRTPVVLGRHGGALGLMTPIFRAGLGGKLGSGRQWMSWIHIDDQAEAALQAVTNEKFDGPINTVAPEPCTNAEFTRALAGAVHRPAFFHVPAFALRTLLGEFSQELLGNKRIVSKHLRKCGFTHRFASLDTTLASLFNTPSFAN